MGRAVGHQPVIPVDVDLAHTQQSNDWHDEETVKKFVRPNRWIAIDLCSYRVLRANWVVFGIASLFMWAVTIVTLAIRDDKGNSVVIDEFEVWKSWIAQNFDWFYVGTQTAWIVFIAW
ncbi:hypothetical protein T484DRAFT_1778338 [Baffinella frigidus]|nr:hypothetical protein T484DRAFT_1778338 [Cryptophyta sp. CCMP2293]